MTKRGQSAEQIIRKLKRADVLSSEGKSIAEICRELGISDTTYYKWRRAYGGMGVDQAKRLKAMEKENGRLKRAVAEPALQVRILDDVASGNFRRRAAQRGSSACTSKIWCVGAPRLSPAAGAPFSCALQEETTGGRGRSAQGNQEFGV